MDSRTLFPLDTSSLIALLTHQRALLEQLLFRHTELRLLIEAGEARFLGRTIDEIDSIESELGTLEMLRAMTTEEIAHGHDLPSDPSLAELIRVVPEPAREGLTVLADDLRELMRAIEGHRTHGSEIAGRRAQRLADASIRPASDGYRSDGSAGLTPGA